MYIVVSRINQYQTLIPQLQGKIEAYYKIVKNEFLALEDIQNIDDGKLRYDMFVKAYNEVREHGGINGLTPSEMFLQRLITSTIHAKNKEQSVTHVGNQNVTYLCRTTINHTKLMHFLVYCIIPTLLIPLILMPIHFFSLF